jgi:hypothetical protein
LYDLEHNNRRGQVTTGTRVHIEDIELTDTQGVMAVMGKEGDTKIIWDRGSEAEVANARRSFDDLRKKGYAAYSVKGKDGAKDGLVREFDPAAERLIFVPPVQGG